MSPSPWTVNTFESGRARFAPVAPGSRPSGPRRDAEAIYRLVFGLLHAHLIQHTRPTAETIGHTVDFCLRGAGLLSVGTGR